MGLFGKVAALSSGLKDKVVAAAEEAELGTKLVNLKDKASDRASDYLAAGKQQAGKLVDAAKEKMEDVDFDALKRRETYVNKFHEYRELSSDKIAAVYRSTFEVDKTTSEMIDGIRGRLPSRPKDIDDIFEQCKREAFQRAISAFCLAPVMVGLDKQLEDRYSNLSVKYKSFNDENVLDDHPNYAEFQNVRKNTEFLGSVDNGYNRNAPLRPADAQIDHIVSKKEYYEDWLLRLSTNDDEIIHVLNHSDNLTFANASFNGGKGSKDLLAYMEKFGTPDPEDPNLVHFQYDKGGDVVINKSDAVAKYETAKERLREAQMAAAKEIGLTVASAGARMAAQQVVGLIVMETIDIFVDEIKDIVKNGKFIDENGLLANIQQRKQSISEKLANRFEERQIWSRAKAAGIDGGVAGALSAIPQILISLIIKMPAFVLSMIRECTLSVVRSVRVLLSDDENKFDSIKVVMLGTATGVLGAYVGNVISKAIAPVPMLNVFNSQVTEVLSGVVVTAVPLGAIYVFDQNKAKLAFSVIGRKATP
ncbi:hypothetical protein KZ686_17770 [Cupriavidus cauae]|uniref:hypothetical protein n=1 Tax=Cupriavidus cauae TaxID=2608999 RepID=UPI00224414F0|nr:hypothetical protein [Cupriavidus cauae]UZN51965.1 hypothetical protein KZ686_17770 [Cupriavidus cauae]